MTATAFPSPLMQAAARGRAELCQILLDAGADVNQRFEPTINGLSVTDGDARLTLTATLRHMITPVPSHNTPLS